MKNFTDQLLKKVKSNKKYKTISDNIIKKGIFDYLKIHPELKNIELNKKNLKKIVKEIRAKLHRLYSSYQTKKKKKREIYLEELKKVLEKNYEEKFIDIKKNFQKNRLPPAKAGGLFGDFSFNRKFFRMLGNDRTLKGAVFNVPDIIKKLLSTTLSTKERLKDYQFVYSKIFSITGKPKTIVDLGAGVNPISYPFMNLSHLNYYSYDIDEEDIKFLNKYFEIMKKNGLNGRAEILDVRDLERIFEIPESDIIFMFKLVDLIDKNNKKISEELIKKLIKKTKFIVVSFATRTLTRKKMNLPRRRGFELMLERIGLKFEMFSIENEVFYVIEK